MSDVKENFSVVDRETGFQKRSLEEIVKDSATIDVSKVSEEILAWTINNVENFVDNELRTFKLGLSIDTAEGMFETQRLQNLYRAIPDDPKSLERMGFDGNGMKDNPVPTNVFNLENFLEESGNCRRILDEVVQKVYSNMKGNSGLLEQLFKRMVFYYEKVIPNSENKRRALEIDNELRKLVLEKDSAQGEEAKKEIQSKIVAKIDEGVKLIKFSELQGAVDIMRFEYEAFDVGVKISDKRSGEVAKEYVVPEGFVLWLQISFKSNQRQTSLF